jgi:2-iminobutanoate/2-iminopropanoate deaminase
VSGQLGIDPTTGRLEDGVEAQAGRALANLEAILAEAGASTSDVAKTTVLLADMADFAGVNSIYAGHFAQPFPARAAFAVKTLPLGALVEIEAVAVIHSPEV